jgi:hypothetical protein
MARISRTTELPGPISAAEALWYDLRRRPGFVEGFGHVVKVEGPWPEAGARIIWDAPRASGRERVVETVEAHEARSGQTVAYEDAQLHGRQTTTFAPAGDGVRVTVALDWKLKDGSPLTDWLFVRRSLGEALRRTLVKYRIERIADLEDERASPGSAP